MTRRAKVITLVLALVGVGLLLIRVRGVLTPFFLGAAIAYISYPLVQRLEEKQVPRMLAILLVYAIFVVVVILTFYALLPSLGRELEEIMAFIPEQTRYVESVLSDGLGRLRNMWIPEGMRDVINLSLQRIESLLERFLGRVTEIVFVTIAHLFNLVLAPFLAYYILRDFERIRRSLVAWLPSKRRKEVLEIATRANRVVAGYLRGQLIVSAIVGLLVAGGLSLLGVRYSLLLGLIAALADIIPYFGPIISGVPAVGLALLQGPVTALWVLILLVAVQQFEGSVLSPKIVGERVGLHPLTVIFAVLTGGELMGILGMFLAVPIAAILKVVGAYVGSKILDG